MDDQRFNSIHLEVPARREDFRRARARLLENCGMQTLAFNRDRLAEAAEAGPCTLIDCADAKPAGLAFWLADSGGVYPLRPGLNSVGRMPDNDVVITDGSVSRRHCAIVVHTHRGCELHDTASKNGTFLNGQRVHGPTRLRNGDEIRMCDHIVVFKSANESASPDSPEFAPTIG
jgi:FHA domain-containing protein